jgi:hypothetical protein
MERLYCGDKVPLPPGYTGYATRFRCLRKGVGIGLYKVRNGQQQAPPPPLLPICIQRPWWTMVPWWVWFFVVLLFLLLVVLVVWFSFR